MFKSKYENNKLFGNLAVKENYKINSIIACINELDSFNYEIQFNNKNVKNIYGCL